ncbi:MAG TPA: DUF47 family protein [archaeon]|nr:DUF47 family protein [archaeon]
MALRNIKHILVVGEKNIFHELSEMIEIAINANAIMTRMLLESSDGKPLTEAMQAIGSLEKKSDDIAFKIAEDVTSGAISPNILDNLLESIQHADSILDYYYNLARELDRMSKAKIEISQIDYKKEWEPLFESMLNLAGKAFSKLEKLFSTSNVADIVEMRKEIQTIEEQGDDIKDGGFDKLYAAAPSLHYIQFLHYSELLHKFDDILDACEDLSDEIVSIVTSILK